MNDINSEVEKYKALLNSLIQNVHNIPVNTQKKKEYSIPYRFLLKLTKDNDVLSKINSSKDKESFKNEINDILTTKKAQLEEILEKQIKEFRIEFIQILNKYQQSSYYNIKKRKNDDMRIKVKDITEDSFSKLFFDDLPIQWQMRINSNKYEIIDIHFQKKDINYAIARMFLYHFSKKNESNANWLYNVIQFLISECVESKFVEKCEDIIEIFKHLNKSLNVTLINMRNLKEYLIQFNLDNSEAGLVSKFLKDTDSILFTEKDIRISKVILELIPELEKNIIGICEKVNFEIILESVLGYSKLDDWKRDLIDYYFDWATQIPLTSFNHFVEFVIQNNFIELAYFKDDLSIDIKDKSAKRFIYLLENGEKFYFITLNKKLLFLELNFDVEAPEQKEFLLFEEFQQEYLDFNEHQQYVKYEQDYLEKTQEYLPTFEAIWKNYQKYGSLPNDIKDDGSNWIVYKFWTISKGMDMRQSLKDAYQYIVSNKKPSPYKTVILEDLIKDEIIVNLPSLFHLIIQNQKKQAVRLKDIFEMDDGFQMPNGFQCRIKDIYNFNKNSFQKKWLFEKTPFITKELINSGCYEQKDVCLLYVSLLPYWQFPNFSLSVNMPITLKEYYERKTEFRCVAFKKVNFNTILKLGPPVRRNSRSNTIDLQFFLEMVKNFCMYNLDIINEKKFQEIWEKYSTDDDFVYIVTNEFLINKNTYSKKKKLFSKQIPKMIRIGNDIGVISQKTGNKVKIFNQRTKKFIYMNQDELIIDNSLRVLPFPVLFTPTLIDKKIIPNHILTGTAIQYLADRKCYLVKTEEGGQYRLKWDIDFEWDDERFIEENLITPDDHGKVKMLKEISIDDDKNVIEHYHVIPEVYQIPSKKDYVNNRMFYDLYHPNSKMCVLPFLNFLSIYLVKSFQWNLLKYALASIEKDKERNSNISNCRNHFCILIKVLWKIWQDLVLKHGTYNESERVLKVQVIDWYNFLSRIQNFSDSSTMHFLKEDLKNPEKTHVYFTKVINLCYKNIKKYHHPIEDLFEYKLYELPTATKDNNVERINCIEESKIEDFDPTTFPNTYLPIFEILLNKNDQDTTELYDIFNMFWYKNGFHKREKSISVVMEFRQLVFINFTKIPEIINSLPKPQKARLLYYCKTQKGNKHSFLHNLCKFLNSISVF